MGHDQPRPDAEASGRDNVASPHDLLAEDPRSITATIPQQAEISPESRWESEGGRLLTERQIAI